MLLAFDLSTSVCGWCVMDSKGACRELGTLTFTQGADLYAKLQQFDALLERTVKRYKPEAFYVEQALKNHHRTRMHTLALLQRFNGMACALTFMRTGIAPQLMDVAAARKAVGIKNDKLLALEWARTELPRETILRDIKKTGTCKDYCYDAADAYVIARAAHVKRNSAVAGGSR